MDCCYFALRRHKYVDTNDHSSPKTLALNASDYDAQWYRLGDFVRYNPGAQHRRRLILDLVQELQFSTVIDVGCGPGELLLLLLRRYPTAAVTGVDLSPAVITANAAAIPSADFRVLDLARGALPATFDLVICSEVIEHLPKWRDGVANLAQMITPGGHLLITCPTGRIYETEVGFGHVEHPEKEALAKTVEALGLETVTLFQWGFPSYLLFKVLANINSDWAAESFGTGEYSAWKRAVSKLLYWTSFASFKDHGRGCQLVGLFRLPRH